MKCEIIRDLLPVYVENVCSGETKKAVEEHLETCGQCREEYEEMKKSIFSEETIYYDEKALMEKGKQSMMAYMRDKVYRWWIFGDTVLNILLIIYAFIWGAGNVRREDTYELLLLILAVIAVGKFLVCDIIYWFRYLRNRKNMETAIISNMVKISIWLKAAVLVCVLIAAIVLGFHAMKEIPFIR